MPDMIQSYLADIARRGGKQPAGWRDDPSPMQIAKLSDAARKAARK
ncbi:hypothetical protein [Leisingera sp. ANG-M1]|nr:hypothetical protein [Leisingera sp. ANG-M1]